MKESKVTKVLITVAAVFAISATAAASPGAGKGLEDSAVRVSYADLNIENAAGAQALYGRLQRASREACGVESYKIAGSVGIKSDMLRCYRNTLTASVEKVDSEQLSKIHAG